MVTKLKKNSNCDKLENSKCDKTQLVTKLKLWQNSNCDKTQVVTKLKWWPNSNCEKKIKNLNVTKLRLWQNLRTQIMTTLKLNLWQNLKTEIGTKLEIWQILIYEDKKNLKWCFSRSILTPWQPMRCSLGSVLRFSRCFLTTWKIFFTMHPSLGSLWHLTCDTWHTGSVINN